MGKNIYRTDIGIKRARERLLFIWIAGIGGSLIFLSLVFLFFLRAPVFRVRSVVIEGAGYIPEDQIQTFLLGKVGQGGFFSNLFGFRNSLTWPPEFKGDDLKLLPDAKEVRIERDSGNRKMIVRITPRIRKGIVCFRKIEPDRCLWFDEEGSVLARAPRTEGPLLLFLNDYARDKAEGPLVEKRLIPNLFSIFGALENIPVAPREVRLEDLALEEVKVPTFTGPTLMFSLRFDAKETPVVFRALSEKVVISSLGSIDLRTENRAYYK